MEADNQLVRPNYEGQLQIKDAVDLKQAAKMVAWRKAKTAEWAQPGSSLRRKLPTQVQFEVWMERQCAKARSGGARGAWPACLRRKRLDAGVLACWR